MYHEDFAQWFRDFDYVKIEVQQQGGESDRLATQMILRAGYREKIEAFGAPPFDPTV